MYTLRKTGDRVIWDELQEKSENYNLKNFRHADDVVCIATDLEDPSTPFLERKITKYLPEDKENTTSKHKMWEIKLNKYVGTEEIMQENKNNMYVILIGNCSPALQSTIKVEVEYLSKSNVSGVIWMLKKVNTIAVGIGTTEKPELTLHEHMMTLFTMI